MKSRLLTGENANKKLSCPEFQARWQALIDECNWSTPFQGIAFATIWFETYSGAFQPVLLIGQNASEQIEHLLVLAINKETKQIVHVGDNLATYQCWISKHTNYSAFLKNALREIAQINPTGKISFKSLPPKLHRQLKNSPNLITNKFTLREKVKRIDCLGDVSASGMAQDNSSEEINENQSWGVSFDTLSFDGKEQENEAGKMLRRALITNDLHQGAVGGSLSFLEDRRMFDFYLALLTVTSEFKMFTVNAQGNLLALVIGSVTSQEYIFDLISYNIFQGAHSFDKALLLRGAEQLAKREGKNIDFTPEGEWTGKYANKIEDVSYFTIYNSDFEFYCDDVLARLKQAFGKTQLTPDNIHRVIGLLKRVTLKRLLKAAMDTLPSKKRENEYRVYCYSVEEAMNLPTIDNIEVNQTIDFLKFKPTESWQTRQNFFSTCLGRFKNGNCGYSYSDDEFLLHSGWLAPLQDKSYFTEVSKEYIYPEPGAVLFDFYTHPKARGQGLYQKSLTRMLKDATHIPGINYIYISVLADNSPSRHVIEKVGFQYLDSVYG